MHQKKSKKIIFYFFLLIVFGSINNKIFSKTKFYQIKEIQITGLENIDNQILLSKLSHFLFQNILLINKNDISKIIENNDLVQNYTILKKYPSNLDVRIEKATFYAKINRYNKIFYVGSNGKLIKTILT